MAKVIFFGTPAYGHFNPTIGVVQELISRGEEVVYYSTPEFQPIIERIGAKFRDYLLPNWDAASYISFGQNLSMGQKSNTYDIEKLIELIMLQMSIYREIMFNQKQDIQKEVMQFKPDYILHDSCAYWGKILAKRLAIPAISSVTVFAYCEKVLERYPDWVIRNIFWMPEVYLENLPGTLKTLHFVAKTIGGLFNISDFDCIDKSFSLEALNIVYTSKEFQWFPELFDSRFKFVGPSICPRPQKDTGGFPLDRLHHQGKIIYISLGTQTQSVAFYRKCLAAFGGTADQVVLAIGKSDTNELGDIPSNFLVGSYIPQLEILKQADLFITHGGMNSVNEALYFNVPMIIIPQKYDQYLVAERVAELGAGLKIENPEFGAPELLQAVQRIFTDDSYRKRGKILGESIRSAGGYQRAVDEIFEFKAEQGIIN